MSDWNICLDNIFQELGLEHEEIEAIDFAFDVYDFKGDGHVDAFFAGDLIRACNLNPTLYLCYIFVYISISLYLYINNWNTGRGYIHAHKNYSKNIVSNYFYLGQKKVAYTNFGSWFTEWEKNNCLGSKRLGPGQRWA